MNRVSQTIKCFDSSALTRRILCIYKYVLNLKVKLLKCPSGAVSARDACFRRRVATVS